MQKIATKIFIYTSVLFGITGVIFVLSISEEAEGTAYFNFLQKLLFICVFVILTSFALSVAGKYLKDK